MSCMAGPSGDEKPRYNMGVSSSSTGLGYCYNTNPEASSSANQNLHHQNHYISQLQGFEPNPAEIYNNLSSSSMEMIGFQSGWNHQQHTQNSFEERPIISQGLSLSLSSTNPPTIGVNTFEVIRQHQSHNDHEFMMRPGSSSSSSYVMIRDSKYLTPAQELLNEFCNLGTRKNDDKVSKMKAQMQDEISPMKKQSLCSLDLMELHKRKTKLLLMLEEVDKRYKHYCNQMKTVVSSFEAVAGNGAATVYSALASRAMSRHFRCLKDGILNEIKATKLAMGEKDTTNVAPGTTKGETPRLRLLDQTLRQQRAFQQMAMIESHPWRPQRGLPERSVSVLRAWLFEHFLHPYPSDVDKHILARQTGLSRSQVSNWFINARVRLWKPMVEEMYMEELKEHEAAAGALDRDPDENNEFQMINQECPDQKPTHDQLFMRNDSECLSSIINNNTDTSRKNKGAAAALLGDDSSTFNHTMELDFSSYEAGGSGGGVSLTLGLQQQDGGSSSGVNLAGFPYPTGRDHQEDWQQHHQYLLDSTEQQMHHQSQTLPYRNLIGEHLLHDFSS